MKGNYFKRGTIIYYDWGNKKNTCVQQRVRPSLVISNDKGNKHSDILIIAAISTKYKEYDLPTHLYFDINNMNFVKEKTNLYGSIMLEQIRTIDKKDVIKVLGELNDKTMQYVNELIALSLISENLTEEQKKVVKSMK